jgi:ADP-heptose:LPS heptosyltransferase
VAANFRNPVPYTVKPKLLVLELWGLGDLAIAAPFLQGALARFDVTLVAKPTAKQLQARFWPEVRVIEFEAPWTAFHRKYALHRWPWRALYELTRELRTTQFDFGVTARLDPRDHLLLAAAGARERIGFPRAGSQMFLTRRLPRPTGIHRSDAWVAIADALDISLSRSADRPSAQTPSGTQKILVHSGAAQLVRVWPLSRYARLVAKLRQDGYRVEVACDRDQLEFWREQGEGATVFSSVPDLIAALDDSWLFVGNDSGPGHVAAISGVPTFTIFGPQVPEAFSPVHPQSEWIAGKPCIYKPCFDSCRYPAPYCLLNVSEEEVWDAVSAFVRRNAAAPRAGNGYATTA